MESFILIILLTAAGVRSADWEVTMTQQCALRLMSVVMKCQYDSRRVRSVEWYRSHFSSGLWTLVPLLNIPSFANDHEYVRDYWGDCSLKINVVQFSDEGRYSFRVWTRQGRYTSDTYSYLSVKELKMELKPSVVAEGGAVHLSCVSECRSPVDIGWFRDGQLVPKPDFLARKEDAGMYYCALLGQKTVRSAAMGLKVHYAPDEVSLSVSPSGDVVKGGSVTFSCSSDASPAVTQSGYSLYKDGRLLHSGQKHTISDVEPSHSGAYSCQAWNNISRRGEEFFNSSEVRLDVQYLPVNISISADPQQFVGGSSVNLTCNSASNPPADIYTWFMRPASTSSMLHLGSGRVLFIPSVNESHVGFYVCRARNPIGETNSTEMLLSLMEKGHGSSSLAITAGVGVLLLVCLVIGLLVWRKQLNRDAKAQNLFDLTLHGSASPSTREDPSGAVYANIQASPPSAPPSTDMPPPPQRSWQQKHHNRTPSEDEDKVVYSQVRFKHIRTGPRSASDGSRLLQELRSPAGEEEESAIYATLAKSH